MEIFVIGLSHHTAPVEVRERFALGGDLARRFLRAVHKENVLEEALVLDTCNRTEVYFVSRRPADSLAYLLGQIARIKGVASPRDTSMLYRHDGASAVEHLFRVAAALDSQVVGEHEILGQVKRAYRTALEERTARFFLNKLLHRSFRVGKRVRTETRLGRGAASVPRAGVDLARQVLGDLTGRTVLLVGAGQAAELAAKALIRCNVGRVTVANRSLSRAEQVVGSLLRAPPDARGSDLDENGSDDEPDAVRCPALLRMRAERAAPHGAGASPPPPERPAQAIELGQIRDIICGVDLVICSTGSPDLVLRYDEIAGALGRSERPLFIVDLAVPRDVDPRLGRLPNVFLHNMDDLDRVVAANLQRRRREIPLAESIIKDELGRFVRWYDSLQVTPTIRLLQEHFGSLQETEIERYGKLFDGDRRQIEQFTQGLCRKILHQPIAFLRELSEKATFSDRLAAVDLVRRMFGLDAREQDE